MRLRRFVVLAIAVCAVGVGAIGCTEEAEKELQKLEKSTKNNPAMNRKVGKIPLGAPVDSVRAQLGKPDSYQVSKSAGLGKTEYLYYGQWQLSFTNGKLESKNKY